MSPSLDQTTALTEKFQICVSYQSALSIALYAASVSASLYTLKITDFKVPSLVLYYFLQV